ncbi:mucin-binding protein [Streptococcus sp. sy004]|uniref:mucin-binding protein n=1 Tax=Streptococcus sp. sy004 TaxID=2600149 RepID=UPI0011B77626|nr:YSIRK-type signal peptide-containing protein [Streptococcus sp. sy004]TWT12425.1 YSIRK-type signal peptide-containing protein [Streptococcus sp. sy004]
MFKDSKHKDTAQRFTIKKFKFGAASVLIGTVFAVFAGAAQAEETVVSTDSSVATAVSTEEVVAESTASEVAPASEATVAEEVSEPVASSEVVASSVAPVVAEEVSESVASSEVTATSTQESSSKEPLASATEASKSEAITIATSSAVLAEKPRVVAETYKVTYTDVETGSVIGNGRNKTTMPVTTTLPDSEVTFEVTEKANMSLPELVGYKLAADQAEIQSAIIAYRSDSKSRTINFNVVRDDVVAAGGNNNNETESAGFRAASSASDVAVSNAVTAEGAIEIADGGALAARTVFSYGIKIANDTYAPGDTITITFEELNGQVSPLQELKSADGTVYATLTSSTISDNIYAAQRSSNTTYDEKVAQHLPATGITSSYTYTFNENVNQVDNIYFGQESSTSIRFPQTSEDKTVTARILVDGVPVVEQSYTVNKAVLADPSTQPVGASTSGVVYFDKEGNYTGDYDTFSVSAGKSTIVAGTTVTFQLNDTTMNVFKQIGDFNTVEVGLGNPATSDSIIPNENGVYLYPDDPGNKAKVRVVSLTEDTIVVEIVEGTINPDQGFSVNLANLGVDRVYQDPETLNYLNAAQTEFKSPNATVTVTGPNGEDIEERQSGSVAWAISRPAESKVISGGDKANFGEVVIRYVLEDDNTVQLQDETTTSYDRTIKKTNKIGQPYDVTSVEIPNQIEKDGVTYVKTSTTPNNVTGTLTSDTIYVYYTYKALQVAEIEYVVEGDENNPLVTDSVKGYATENIDYSTQSRIEEFSTRYKLVADGFEPTAVYDNDVTITQKFRVVLRKIVPTATPAETTGKQGQTQSQDATTMFTEGDEVAPIDNSTITLLDTDGMPTTSVTVEGQGTYTLENGTIKFTPLPSYVGTATPVEVRAADKNGTTVKTTYTPTVTPVNPTATPAETTGKQGQTQSQDATTMFTEGDEVAPIDNSTITLLDTDGMPTTSVTVEGQGTYTLENGTIKFTPLPSYVGTATPVEVRAADKNGTTVKTTYTPTVTPVEITATNDESTGVQGATQTGQITSSITNGDNVTKVTYTFDGETTKVVPGEGTYTVDSETGKVTFVPEANFVGKATPVEVTVTATITNGNGEESTISAKGTYTPTVTPVEITATNDESTGVQGATQTGQITSSITNGDNVTKVTYTFDGETTKVVPGEGTYTVDSETGKVTFVPEANFVGKATPVEVTVTATITNGNGEESTISAKGTYTPTVTARTTSFVDVNGNPLLPNEEGNVPSKDIPGYEIISSTTDENGNTIHTYRKVSTPITSFVDEEGNVISPNEDGKQPSKEISGYKLVGSSTDENGNVVHTYRKVVKTTTSFVDGDGNPILPNEEGNVPSKDIPGYEIISSTTDENGNTIHTYRKVSTPITSFVDEEGNVISPNEDGKQPSKEISGYKLVGSSTDENGNVVHTYRKVVKTTTSFVDGDGNPILPNEEGNVPSKDIPGYEIISSTTDENGNTIHTYLKVVKTTTSFVDGDGNPILPNEEGNVPSKDIPGYEIISSTTDENGNTVHTYRKVTTPVTSFVDEDGKVISPNEDGKQPSKAISGYELVGSSTDENGNVVHTYRKVVKKDEPSVMTPHSPKTPNPAKPAEAKPAPATKTTNKLDVLPNTGTENTATASALGVGMILTALGLAGKRRRKED